MDAGTTVNSREKKRNHVSKKEYTNGQKVNEIIENRLIWFFKTGKINAEGIFENDKIGKKIK